MFGSNKTAGFQNPAGGDFWFFQMLAAEKMMQVSSRHHSN
jgi:hypothetical protein